MMPDSFWNRMDSIMDAQAAYAKAGGRFILPMPAVRVV